MFKCAELIKEMRFEMLLEETEGMLISEILGKTVPKLGSSS